MFPADLVTFTEEIFHVFYGQRNKKQIRNYKFFGMDYLLVSLSESAITRKGFLKCHKKT